MSQTEPLVPEMVTNFKNQVKFSVFRPAGQKPMVFALFISYQLIWVLNMPK
jgi:hypothetical protein